MQYNQTINIDNKIVLTRTIHEWYSSGAFECDGKERLYRGVQTGWSIYDKRENTRWIRVPQSLFDDLTDLCSNPDEDQLNNLPLLSELMEYHLPDAEYHRFLEHNELDLIK